MKYVKMLGLAVLVAAAPMAFAGAGVASATVLTSPAGAGLPAGTELQAVSEEKPTLTGGFKNIECNKSTIAGRIANAGGATETVRGLVETLTFEECNCTVKVIHKGALEIHKIGTGPNGTVVSDGATVTVSCATIFGTVHCDYETLNTDLGTLTGSTTTGGTATMDITAVIPIEPGESNELCAEESTWHAKYKVTTPDFLDVS